MKKLVSVLLVLAMVFSMATVVFAESSPQKSPTMGGGTITSSNSSVSKLSSTDAVAKKVKAASSAEAFIEALDLENAVEKLISDYSISQDMFELKINSSAKTPVTVEFSVAGVKTTNTVVVLVNTSGDNWEVVKATAGSGKVSAELSKSGKVLVLIGSAPVVNPFNDISSSAWYYDSAMFCAKEGLMTGIGGGKFAPNVLTTRSMVVSMLYRLAGSPAVTGKTTFLDTPDAWYQDAIAWAYENKIVLGYNSTTFGPNDAISREQLATMIYNYAKSKGEGFTGSWMFLLDYPDATNVSSWADEAMHWCNMKGIISGCKDTASGKTVLNPTGSSTRAELAQVFYNYLK